MGEERPRGPITWGRRGQEVYIYSVVWTLSLRWDVEV